jgi:hypothetical protein
MVNCRYCKNEGHNITSCNEYKIKISTYILGNDDNLRIGREGWRLRGGECCPVPYVNIEKLAHMRLVKETDFPFMIWKYKLGHHQVTKEIRYENNSFLLGDLAADDETSENRWNVHVATNTHLIREYKNDYKTRMDYYNDTFNGTGVRPRTHGWCKKIIKNIFTKVDYIEYIIEMLTKLTDDIERQNRERQERNREREGQIPRQIYNDFLQLVELHGLDHIRQNPQLVHHLDHPFFQARPDRPINFPRAFDPDPVPAPVPVPVPDPLPNIRETAIESDDCPVCLDTFGEVGKTVLRCGHQICTSCLFIQTRNGVGQCLCPVCRAPYV